MFALVQFHHRSISELEGMLPWEFDVYLVMLMQHIEEERQKARDAASAARATRNQ